MTEVSYTVKMVVDTEAETATVTIQVEDQTAIYTARRQSDRSFVYEMNGYRPDLFVIGDTYYRALSEQLSFAANQVIERAMNDLRDSLEGEARPVHYAELMPLVMVLRYRPTQPASIPEGATIFGLPVRKAEPGSFTRRSNDEQQ